MPNAFMNPPQTQPQFSESLDDLDFNPFSQPFQTPENTEQEEPVEVENQPQPSQKNIPKRFAGRAKPVPWTQVEEIALTKAWLYHSENDIVGDQQEHDTFWGKCLSHFADAVRGTERTIHQLNSKWGTMNSKIQAFNGIYNRLKHKWASGHNDEDLFTKAMSEYKLHYEKKGFNHIEPWKLVRNHHKWASVPAVGAMDAPTGSSKRSKTSESGGYTTSSQEGPSSTVPDLNEDTTPTRPARKGKKKVETSETSGIIADAITGYKTLKQQEKEERRLLREKIAEEKMAMLQLNKTSIAERMMDRDIKVFLEPHDHIPQPVLETVLERKRGIAKRYGWDCDF